jgi:hypothetical protein
MAAYAQGTNVSIVNSINELDRMVTKHGATGFAYGRDEGRLGNRVMFRLANRMMRFEVPTPDWHDFLSTPTGRSRTPYAAHGLADAEERRRWRSLVLVIKALLVGIDDGVISLSDAFLAYTVLPSGETVGEWSAPQLDTAYATSRMPALMPGGEAPLPAIEVGS